MSISIVNNVWKVMLLMMVILLIYSELAYPAYGVIPESDIDPSVMRIDEEKFLGAKVSGDYQLIDENGKEFRLNEILGKPVILVLSYYSCNGVCPAVNSKLKNVLARIEKMKTGEDYRVLTLSFDTNDNFQQADMLIQMAGLQESAGKGWKVAVMKNKEDIKKLTNSIGYKYFWSARDKMFVHPNTLIFLSPEGRVMRYLYGSSPDVKNVQLAITESRAGITSGSGVIDLVSMACYSYNFKEGRYTMNYPLFIGFGSVLLGISSVVIPIVVRKKRKESRSCTKDS